MSGQEGMKASRQGASPSLRGGSHPEIKALLSLECSSATEEVLAGELGLGARGL